MTKPAVFLDRDGTIIEEHGHLGDADRVSLIGNAAEAIGLLRDAGYPVFVVTNQSGISRQLFTTQDMEAVHFRMVAMLAGQGVKVDGIYFCPHHPDFGGECACRKPRPGMLEQAAREHDLDLSSSFIVGDFDRDLQAGRAVGARTVLVRTGHGEKTLAGESSHPDADHVAADLLEAAKWICSTT